MTPESAVRSRKPPDPGQAGGRGSGPTGSPARPSIRFVAALALWAALTGACRSAPANSDRSVILVTLDTTRADRIGAYGGRAVPTPNLDAVASEGVLFENAVSPVPLTLPAHCSILTGRYPASHGVRHNGIFRLPASVGSLASRFRGAGFATAAVVGAYVLNRGFGTERGFDVYDDVEESRVAGGPEHELEAQRSADEVNERVFRWLDRHAQQRFFLWVHYYDPHLPYAPPETPGRTLFGTGYDREISYVDACFGDLWSRLVRTGASDRTLLIVAGDHGESLGEHGEESHGLLLYEGAVRVPLLFRAPGLLPAGRRVSAPVDLVDVAPTVLDLMRMPPLDGAQGRSLAGLLSGQETGEGRLAFAETLMGRLEYGWSDLYMARSARFKYIEAPTPELYDLRQDPGETTNLATNERKRTEEMAASVRTWIASASLGSAGAAAQRELEPDEEARLRSLGYLGGDAFKADAGTAGPGSRPDPKAMIEEARAISSAAARFARGEAAEALAQIESVLEANPRNSRARETRVEILSKLGRFGEAEEEATAGIHLARTDPGAPKVVTERALGLLAVTYRRQNKLADAERVLREIIAEFPEGTVAPADLARILADQGRPDEALALAGGVLARDPRNGVALAARFVAETRLERKEEALASARALAGAHGADAVALIDAGDALMRAREADAAARAYAAATSQMASNGVLWGKLGAAHFAARRPGDARRAFLEAVRLAPENPRVYHFLGQIALEEGDEAGARAQFSIALRQDPTYNAPLLTLARWLERRGRGDEAREALREALRRNPGDEQARRALGEP